MDTNKIVASRDIKDPKTGLDIIQAKMVEDLKIEGNHVQFSIVLPKEMDQNRQESRLNFVCMEAVGFSCRLRGYSFWKINQTRTKSNSILPQVKTW